MRGCAVIRDFFPSTAVEGKTMMEYQDSGTHVVKQFPMTIQETLLEARYALMVKDPIKYGSPDRVRVINMLNNFRGF